MDLDRAARLVWDYHHVGHALAPADGIVVLGSHDLRVARRGAELFLAGWAPLVVFTGGLGSLTRGMWSRPEAEIFADAAAAMGVPRERMLIEDRSTRELLRQRGLESSRRTRLWSGRATRGG